MLIKSSWLVALGIIGLLCLTGCGTVKIYQPTPVVEYETKYIYDLKHFESKAELESWLATKLIPYGSCAEMAEWLCQAGADDGYYIYYISLYPEDYEAMFGWHFTDRHALNYTWAGGQRYWIDTTNGKGLWPE